MGNEEQELIARCKAGDKSAFEPIVKAHMERAYYAALGLVGDHDEALDISQEAFAKAYRAISSFDSKRPFYPWFYRILRNLGINRLKRLRRERERSESLEAAEAQGGSTPVNRDTPSVIAERTELKDKMWEAISQLSEVEREVIVLKHFQDMRYKEIAEALDCPIGTVMSRLHSARHKLREKMKKYL